VSILTIRAKALGRKIKIMTNTNDREVDDLTSRAEEAGETNIQQNFSNLNQIEGEEIRGKFGIGRITAILDGQLSLPLFEDSKNNINNLNLLETATVSRKLTGE
jgi:hypothetical protein